MSADVIDHAASVADPVAGLLDRIHTPPPGVPRHIWENGVAAPLAEFLGRPSKNFRGRLVKLAWSIAGRQDDPPPSLPLMVELIHAGSLIVDDIEDGSLQRRGRASLHRVVGVPVALNLGNWLYFWPMTILQELRLDPAVELQLHRALIDAIRRCHEGQALDLTARIGDLHPSEIHGVTSLISTWKTGSLMSFAARLGAAAGGADPNLIQALALFGERLGVGLQMQNDLSELTGAAGPIKHPEDLVHGRVTWPWAWSARLTPADRFDALQIRGAKLCDGSGDAASLARDLRASLGPEPGLEVREWLGRAMFELRARVGDHPNLADLETELVRLETHYA